MIYIPVTLPLVETRIEMPASPTSFFFKEVGLIDRYAAEYRYAMTENWDAEGAKRLTDEVVKLAGDIVAHNSHGIDPVEVTPGTDGSLSFVWEDDADNYIYVDIGPSRTVHLFHRLRGLGRWEGVSVADDQKIIDRFRGAMDEFYAAYPKPIRYFIIPNAANIILHVANNVSSARAA